MSARLLDIEDLSVSFHTPEGVARAVDGVSFELDRGDSLGIVGESGCGKSVTSLSILRLIPSPPGVIESGRIRFEDRNLLELDPEGMRKIRGRDISMIFQEPMTSLNPVLPIGRQVAEPLMIHKGLTTAQALEEAAQWLDRVKIPAARKRLDDYPHQLSGGMRQRVMIAMAMVCGPRLLIADEPTTALDVTIQAQILSLMVGLKEEYRHGAASDHPQPGCRGPNGLAGGGHVCRTGGGGGRGGGPVSNGRSTPTRTAFCDPCRVWEAGAEAATEAPPGNTRHCAGDHRDPPGVPVCRALPACVRSLPAASRRACSRSEAGQRARCWLKEYPERRRSDA